MRDTSISRRAFMEAQVVEECYISEVHVRKGDKFNLEEIKAAIVRINCSVEWTHNNEEIFAIIESKPKFCYFAKLDTDIVGYAILREDGEDCHLHVSWIATDVLNRGIGTLLMHKIIHQNKKLGNRILTLHHKNNSQLKHFYEKIAKLEAVGYLCEETSKGGYRITYEM